VKRAIDGRCAGRRIGEVQEEEEEGGNVEDRINIK
jgi:hypothetical protein